MREGSGRNENKMNKKYVYTEKGANLSVMKIDAVHCFVCGEQFQKTGDRIKTNHHGIPEELKPLRNIVIPVCKGCHKLIHQDSQAMNPKKLKVLRKVKSMKKHYSTIDDGFDNIIKDLENNGRE